MFDLSGLITNLLSSAIWSIAGIILAFISLRFTMIRRALSKLGVNTYINKPQLAFDTEYDSERQQTKITIKNAGDRAAYNVYAFLFEIYHATDEEAYLIKSLGNQKVKIGILASNESISFEDKNIMFEGCNVTAEQEVWIEYTDEYNTHYRTRMLPPSPRGDDAKILPPAQIKKRLPMLPSLKYTGKKDWASIRNGKKGIPNTEF